MDEANVKMEVSLTSARFYGHSLDGIYDDLEKKIEQARKQRPADVYNKPRSVLQPSPYKEWFWKQNDALRNAAEHSKDDDILSCFIYHDENEKRRFIVTYAEDFWEECKHMPKEKKVFYEVIPEHSPCFLYYDLEFDTELNKDKDGIKMTSTLIDITCAYIAKYWNYSCTRNMVINLDSSRQGKFSKHLIFSTRDVAFENNYHVGYLVKTICIDIINFISSANTEHDILNKFNRSDLEQLFVETNKEKKLFVDINVYSKNRHFRIYKATKWGKNSHLIYAADCEYKCEDKSKNKDLNIFLNSLISYLPKKKKLNLLSFDQNNKTLTQSYSQYAEKCLTQSLRFKEYPTSPYPALDRYVSNLIKPGKIRISKYIDQYGLIIFEVLGNRYCKNIGRWHKSNNIYYTVDIKNKIIYQKCHDEDCAGFSSTPRKLPEEVTFYFQDEIDSILSTIEFQEETA